MRSIGLIGLGAAAALLAGGCGGDTKYVRVSGIVTLNGEPYKNAVVSFQPIGSKENPNPGRGSSALTDENGRFTLVTDDGRTGAVVGMHRVRIQTKRDDPTEFVDPTVGSPDDPPPPKQGRVDPIPVEWYGDQSTKEFEGPSGGTDKADFDIVTSKGTKK